jgi:hypothetical protein
MRQTRIICKTSSIAFAMALSMGPGSPALATSAGAIQPGSLPSQQASSEAALVDDRWQVVPEGDGVFRVLQGSRFGIAVTQPISTATAEIGDPVYARLTDDLKLDGGVVATAGALVSGHIMSVDRARRQLRSDIPGHHWLDANGGVAIAFDELLADNGQSLDIDAMPAPGTQVQRADSHSAPLAVDKRGDISFSYKGKTFGALGLAIEGASLASGPFALAVGPTLSGIAGALSPSYAFGRPSQDVSGHRRIKGFFMGAVKGAPGGFLVSGAVNHGDNVSLLPGDRLVVELTADLVVQIKGKPPAKP